MRAVLDPNVIISATLSPEGSPGRIFQYWLGGVYELVVSPMLLAELERALNYPKLRDRVSTDERQTLLDILKRGGEIVQDPDSPPDVRSPDREDNYLIALASISRSVLISADSDLLGLSGQIPVYSPTEFLAMFEARDQNGS